MSTDLRAPTGDDLIDMFNKRWTKVSHEGKNLVVGKKRSSIGGFKYVFYSHKDFIELYRAEDKIQMLVDGKPKDLNPAIYWLNSKLAVHAENGFLFDPVSEPGGIIDGMFNLWVGWGTDIEKLMNEETLESLQKDDDIRAYFRHVRDVIFHDEPAAFKYFLNWLSHMVQKPYQKPGVAPILKGGKGVGKGLVMLPLGKIAGSHYVHLTRGSQLTGKFNAVIENKILAFADEFGSGDDKRTRTLVSNSLKGLITESLSNIERKGKDVISVRCYMRVVISSNFDSPVDISRDERRYVVVDIPSELKRDPDYYDDLAQRINTKEFANKLHAFLMKRDISNFNPFTAPSTKELEIQKVSSMSPSEKYVYEQLQSGHWRRSWRPSGTEYTNWPSYINVAAECEYDASFSGFMIRNKLHCLDPNRELGKLLKSLFNSRKRITENGSRPWVYEIPSLDEARARWDDYFGTESEWD